MTTVDLPTTVLKIGASWALQRVDLRLDRRVGRDADVQRLVEVGRLVDDALLARADHEPHAREAEALAPVLGHEHAVRPRRQHLLVGVVADHDVDVRRRRRRGRRAGPVGSVSVPAVAPRWPIATTASIFFASLAASALTASVELRDVERIERARLRQRRDVVVREADDADLDAVLERERRATATTPPASCRSRRRCSTRRTGSSPAGSAACRRKSAPRSKLWLPRPSMSMPIMFMISIVGLSSKNAEIGGVAPTESPAAISITPACFVARRAPTRPRRSRTTS